MLDFAARPASQVEQGHFPQSSSCKSLPTDCNSPACVHRHHTAILLATLTWACAGVSLQCDLASFVPMHILYCLYIYIYIQAHMYVHTHIYIYMYTYTYTYQYIYIYIFVYIYICACEYSYVSVSTYMHVYTNRICFRSEWRM